MKETKIEWTDHSWSPWRGCTKVSPGCANCYAESLSERFNRKDSAIPTWGGWGKGKPRVLAKNWGDPVKWNKAAEEELEMRLAYGKGRPPHAKTSFTVFPSLCDWLDEEVPVEWLARFLKLIHDTPNLTWLLLTKRPENWRERINRAIAVACEEPWTSSASDFREWLTRWVDHSICPRNVWIGTSVEDQQRADERIPTLLRIPAAGRFLSVEPMLGPVDLENVEVPEEHDQLRRPWEIEGSKFNSIRKYDEDQFHQAPQVIDWVIIGGESGPLSRPCNVEWVRGVVRQCAESGVPCFVKQLGAKPLLKPCRQHHFDWRHKTSNADRADDELFTEDCGQWRILLNHPKGGDPEEWPEYLRVRQFPEGLR